MQTSLRSLWPPEISVDVVSPLAILRCQASALSQITQGLLRAEVIADLPDGEKKFYHLEITAPVLNDHRVRLMTIWWMGDDVYPAFARDATLHSTQEFMDMVANELSSSSTISLLHSLIARINEKLSDTSTKPDSEAEKVS